MSFTYTPNPVDDAERRIHRRLSVLPALMSWLLLAVFAVAGLASPTLGSALVVAFLLYYSVRVAHNTLFLTLSFLRVRAEEGSDWLARLDDLEGRPGAAARLKARADRYHARVMETVRASGAPRPRLSDLVHVVVIPICNEGRVVWEPGIRQLAAGVLDPRRYLIVVLAVEENAPGGVLGDARAACDRYEGSFREMMLVVHPGGLEGEIPGKGSNVSYAARTIAAHLGRRGIDLANVLLTCVDADAVASTRYFACLSYYFLAEPDRTRSCYQPLAVFSNNIWRVPAFVRVVEMGATVFQLIDSTSVDQMVTFSCYSYSLRALADAGWWPTDVVAEDAAIFWKTMLHFRGGLRAVPLPVTVRMDAAEGPTLWKTLTSMYRQKVRWAFGAENLAIVFRGIFRHGLLEGRRKWNTVLKLVDTNLTAATLPFVLSILTWAPQVYRLLSAVIPLPVFNLSRISGVIFQLSGVFLVLIVIVTGFLAYGASGRGPLWKKLLYPLEWFLVLPVAGLVFGSLPALQAQTRLALGKPLRYVPMVKIREPGAA